MRVGDGHINWKADDHHGTTQWTVDGDALTTKVRRLDPFGSERDVSTSTWPDQRGFVDGIENESTGLTTLGAREYDPELGRFASADPVSDFFDPQQINGYAYANNSPVAMTDPDGLRHRSGKGKGQVGTGNGGAARAGKGVGGGGSGGAGKGTSQKGVGGGGGGRGGSNGSAGNGAAAGRGQCDAACREAQKERDQKLAYDRQKQEAWDQWQEWQARQKRDRDRQQEQERNRRRAIYDSFAWLRQDDAALWLASDYMWGKYATPACGLASLACSAYVGQEPPGSYGLCAGGGVGIGGTLGVSTCAMYTRDDGWVLTGTSGGGAGEVLNVGVWAGPSVSSSTSADGLAGWSTGVSASGKWFAGAGAAAAFSDNGDWGFTPSVGAGWGGGVGGTRDHTWAVDFDDFEWPW